MTGIMKVDSTNATTPSRFGLIIDLLFDRYGKEP
jgi:hypothetical protein